MTYYRTMPPPRPVRIFDTHERLSAETPFHDLFREEAAKLGGIYSSGRWQFPASVTTEARRLLQSCFGQGEPDAESTLVTIRVRAKAEFSRTKGQIMFGSRVVAAARGRDSDAAPGVDVSLVKGRIWSGGSSANWCVGIDEGSIFEIRRVRRSDAVSTDRLEVISIDGVDCANDDEARRQALLSRRQELCDQLAHVDAELAGLVSDY